jgi:hypothetical protein
MEERRELLMKRAILILSAFILAFSFSITGFAKDNNNGGANYFDSNENYSGSTNNTGGNGGTNYFDSNVDTSGSTNNKTGNGGATYIP